MSVSDKSARAALSPTALPSPSAASMPSHMFFTSLDWLTTQAGVPQPVAETPPTSPMKLAVHTAAGVQSPEQRREKQAAFIREKNRELIELRQKTSTYAALIADEEDTNAKASAAAANAVGDDEPVESALSTDEPAPSTPKKRLSASASAPDAVTMVSPEKRRAKKLSSLQYPIFSVQWWDVPASSAARQSAKDAAGSETPTLGLVLLGGGGGRKGAGIDSGLMVCSVLPSNAAILQAASSPIRMSTVSEKALALNPVSFLDSNDFLIGSMLPHPHEPFLAATVGAGTALLQAEGAGEQLTFHYRNAAQTDFHQELNAQAQAWSPSGRWLVTGGEDRCLRIWSYPALQLIGVCTGNKLGLDTKDEQHRQPILSLHVNHDGTRVASCAGDGNVKIWNTSKLEGSLDGEDSDDEEEYERKSFTPVTVRSCALVQNLTIAPNKGAILKFQVARFYGKARLKPARPSRKDDDSESESEQHEPLLTGAPETEYLVAIASQIKRGGHSSSLIKFETDGDWRRVKQVHTGDAPLTTMEISDDVRNPYVALANTDGLVAIYTSDNFKCLKRIKKCHDLPTTALAFSPARLATPATSSSLAAGRWLVSASADKSVALISVPSQKGGRSLTTILQLLLALLVLFLAWYFEVTPAISSAAA